eukprot:TRINITY_DN6813_c0_g1_i2.p4 TRINITY_DN6813_c0_g1~~TRINITY_DN6813_c0_g1_i2.p4  ORF type:complete len:142 (+),score=47.86 TRINITY_DN6813_c0_g1_i2:103-528(+)
MSLLQNDQLQSQQQYSEISKNQEKNIDQCSHIGELVEDDIQKKKKKLDKQQQQISEDSISFLLLGQQSEIKKDVKSDFQLQPEKREIQVEEKQDSKEKQDSQKKEEKVDVEEKQEKNEIPEKFGKLQSCLLYTSPSPRDQA